MVPADTPLRYVAALLAVGAARARGGQSEFLGSGGEAVDELFASEELSPLEGDLGVPMRCASDRDAVVLRQGHHRVEDVA